MQYFWNYIICCKWHCFAAFCSNLIIFWQRNCLDSIQNAKLPLNINYGRYWYKTFEVIPFAADNDVLQHFAATWGFMWKKSFWINSECLTTPVYQVWKKSMRYYPNYAICNIFRPYNWKTCCSSSSSSSSKKKFDNMNLLLISNEEKSMSFRKKI